MTTQLNESCRPVSECTSDSTVFTSQKLMGHPMRKMKIIISLIATASVAFAAGDQLISTKKGTTWQYNMTQEVGEGITLSGAKSEADGKVRAPVIYRIAGMENVDGKNLIEFEMHRDGVVTNTDLITVDEHGIVCWGRINLEGDLVELDPPQTMIAAPLKAGTKWEFDGQVADLKAHQHYDVIGEEDVAVPAGKFRAFRIRCEQTLPTRTTIDRWFVPAIGIVKDVTTMRSDDGDLVQRISLELQERPKIADRPQVKPTEPPKKLLANLAIEPRGEASTTFASDTPKIYARWQGHRLREHAKVRVVWVAEKVEDVPADHKVDEAFTFADGPSSSGIFTLSQPEEGWAPGNYRAEFYVDEELQETVKLKITK